jgi:hypothetical protein
MSIYNATPTLWHIKDIYLYSKGSGIELGYLLISSVFKTLNFNYQSIYIFSATITFCFLYVTMKKHTSYPAVALFVFFAQYFSLPFIQMRFGIALAIGLYACSLLYLGQKKKYWFFIILAALFHISALGLIVFFFFQRIKWTEESNLAFFILAIFLFLLIFLPMGSIWKFIMSRFSIEKYRNYANTEPANLRSLLVIFLYTLPLIMLRRNFKSFEVDVNLFLSLTFGGLFIGVLVWRLGILNRFSMINTSIVCMIIPNYLLLFKYYSAKIVAFFVLFLFCCIKFIPNLQYITPYRSFINY